MNIRVLMAVLVAEALAAGAAFAQEAGKDFHIAGTVINSLTGEPVRQALVTVRPMRAFRGRERGDQYQAPAQPAPALTDLAGAFQIGRLASGSYQLSAQKPGFAADRTAARTIELGPSRDDAAMRLTPLAVITGTVRDGEGEPVAGAAIRAYRSEIREGRRQFTQASSVNTDDIGHYRLWNLQPGEYCILAAGKGGGAQLYVGDHAPPGGPPEGFAPTYYPRGPDRATAARITLTPGQESQADVSVTMQPVVRVRGMLRNFTPYQPVQVELFRGTQEISANRAAVDATTGRFEVRDVVPGSYRLRATQGKGKEARLGLNPLEVGRSDIDGVVLDLTAGVVVTGTVQGGVEGPQLGRRFGNCEVELHSTDGAPGTAAYQGTADQDGKLAIDGVAQGSYRVQIRTFGSYVGSAVSGNQNLLDGGVMVVTAGAPPEPLEIVLKHDGGTISGSASGVDQADPGSMLVLLVAVSGSREPLVLPLDGSPFRFDGLAPGDYQAYLLKDVNSVEYTNPEVVRTLSNGESIHVANGGTANVTLKAAAQ
jgi:hypothetical protein